MNQAEDKGVSRSERIISQILGVILVLTTGQQAWAMRDRLEFVHFLAFGLAIIYTVALYVYARKSKS